MTGAEAVLQTASAAGVEVCFANPGTTEMALVNALDAVPIRAVLGLFEGVCSDADAPLSSDIASLARPVSRWVRETKAPAEVALDAAEAIAAAQEAPGGVATLIIPADCQSGEAPGPAQSIPSVPARPVGADRIEHLAKQLRRGKNAALHLGGRALSVRGQRAAGRVARVTGCRMFSERFPAR